MTSRDFCYWLQGFFELQNPNTVTGTQVQLIKNHLNLVFKHEIDPSINKHHTPEEVAELNDIHIGHPYEQAAKLMLQELGEQHNFSVYNGGNNGNFGPCPGDGYQMGLHG